MNKNHEMTIQIPSDNEGFVLLQCEYCGNFFKIKTSDAEDDKLLRIFCPSCGLSSESYVTTDVIELATVMAKNMAMDLIYDEFNYLERTSKKGAISFKAGTHPKHEHKPPIYSGIEALEKYYFPCCKRISKVKPLLKFTGCYCPFCGVKNYEDK